MINQVCYFFIFFGGFMSWTVAIGIVIEHEKRIYHYAFSGMMFCAGVLLITNGLLLIADYTALTFWYLPLLAWFGPLFFFSFKSANDDSFKLRPINFLHFLPGLLVLLLMIPLITMDPHAKSSYIMRAPDLTSSDRLYRLYSVLYIAVICNLFVYMAYFFRNCFFMLNIRLIYEKKISPYLVMFALSILPFLVVLLGGMLIIGILGYGRSMHITLIKFLSASSFLVILAIYIMEKKGINFFKLLKRQIKQRQYEISNLMNLDVSMALSRIQSLMQEEKIFYHENLSVKGLAEMLSIKPYQLSLIINENFGKNFNYFVNEYRIEEAKKLFSEDSRRTIISVAYKVGFNSISAFNEWFKRITGVSPKRFREAAKGRQLMV